MKKTLSSLSLALIVGFTALLFTGCLVVQETGQTEEYKEGDDGYYKNGVGLPPHKRFTKVENGTIKDNLTGLFWLKNTDCWGSLTWNDAIAFSNNIEDGQCGLKYGYANGGCRLPNIRELSSLIDFGTIDPALPLGYPFDNLHYQESEGRYWSSTTFTDDAGPASAWIIYMGTGLLGHSVKSETAYAWAICEPSN